MFRRVYEVRQRRGPFQLELTCSLLFRWQCEGSFNYLHKISLFTKNHTFALRQREVRKSLSIRTQARAIRFICGKAIERDQPPGDVVCAFMRQEVTDEMPAATRDDAPPILCVRLELITLERIDLITNDASNHTVSSSLN